MSTPCPNCGKPLTLVIAGTPPTEPPTGQPPVSGETIYPAELQSKRKTHTNLPWKTGTRLEGPTISFDDAWIVDFTTGGSQVEPVRIQAVERQGGPMARIGILFRRSDGNVIARYASTSLTFICKVDQPSDPYKLALKANTAYAVGIYNQHANEAGPMFCDLYL